MKYGATPTNRCSLATVGDVEWIASVTRRNGSGPVTIRKPFTARSWFDARRQAMLEFRCEAAELEVVMFELTEVNKPGE